MAFETKYKKRGSNFSLIIMLIALLGLVAAIILWPGAEEQTVTAELPEEEEVIVEEPKADMTDEEREIEATTLVKVGQVAPDFSVEMLDGRVIKLSELRGRSRWERADVDDDEEPRMPKSQQRYDTRRGEVPVRRAVPQQPQRPRPEIISTPKPIDPARAGMRSVGVRSEAQQAPAEGCAYRISERVEHPKFGAGTIERIEALATDHKIVVMFDEYGTKTLLAKFAKLRKL
jgi:hypothetical protein